MLHFGARRVHCGQWADELETAWLVCRQHPCQAVPGRADRRPFIGPSRASAPLVPCNLFHLFLHLDND
eukprot:338779-Chlamydomonas_euryale.AAC.3